MLFLLLDPISSCNAAMLEAMSFALQYGCYCHTIAMICTKVNVISHACCCSSREMFGVVFESMLGIGFEKEELQDVYTILAAVILLGDIVSYIIPILCYNHIARVSI